MGYTEEDAARDRALGTAPGVPGVDVTPEEAWASIESGNYTIRDLKVAMLDLRGGGRTDMATLTELGTVGTQVSEAMARIEALEREVGFKMDDPATDHLRHPPADRPVEAGEPDAVSPTSEPDSPHSEEEVAAAVEAAQAAAVAAGAVTASEINAAVEAAAAGEGEA